MKKADWEKLKDELHHASDDELIQSLHNAGIGAEKLDLKKIREVTEKATYGPWKVEYKEVAKFKNLGGMYVDRIVSDNGYTAGDSAEDLNFIANSRQWVPALCDEVERLREENENLKAVIKDQGNSMLEKDQRIAVLKRALKTCVSDATGKFCPWAIKTGRRRCSEHPRERDWKCASCAPEYYIQQAKEAEE